MLRLKKNRGFTLLELIITIAISGVILSVIFSIFGSIYQLTNTETNLSQTQISAQMVMDKVKTQIRFANMLDIEPGSPPVTLNPNYIYIYVPSDGAIHQKTTLSDQIISPSPATGAYTYSLSFAPVNTKVLQINLSVLSSNVVMYKYSSNILINNLISNNITGASSGSYISFQVTLQTSTLVTSITVMSPNNFIVTNGATLQMSTTVLPSGATNKAVGWSVNMPAIANINQAGLLTPLENGTVTVIASAVDGSGVIGTKQITISNQNITISALTLTTSTGSNNLSDNGNHITIIPNITPSNATNQHITWSVDDTSYATIDSNGVLTSKNIYNVPVIVFASTSDGSGIIATIEILITT